MCPLLHWAKRSQCQYTYLSLANAYYYLGFKKEFLTEYVTWATDFDWFPLAWSLTHDKVILGILSIWLRETAEFHNYPLVALSVFYKCMLWCKSPGHKCDNILLFQRVIPIPTICMIRGSCLSRNHIAYSVRCSVVPFNTSLFAINLYSAVGTALRHNDTTIPSSISNWVRL